MSLPGLGLNDIVGTIIFYHDQQQIAKYLAVVSLTLLIYDWVLNIDLEIAFVWGYSWSWGRIIYHANRVWPIVLLGVTLTVILFLPLPSPSVQANRFYVLIWCHVSMYYHISDVTFAMLGTLRGKESGLVGMSQCVVENAYICAAYRTLFGGLFGAIVSGIVIIKFLLDRTAFLDNPLPNVFSGCVVMMPDYVWILYIMPLVYELTLFVFTTWRIYILSKDFESTPLMQTLAQNGMAYFATLVVLMILACIGGTIDTVKIASNASGVLSAISSVVCSRMIFSLYRITRKERLEDLTISATDGDTNESIIPRFAIPMQSLVSTSISCN